MSAGRPAWYDIEMRGRRLEAISKQMNTLFWKNYQTNPSLAFAYFDRFLKIESTIQPYVEQITGVRKLLKQGTKLEPIPQ